jgi:hypothetical protein
MQGQPTPQSWQESLMHKLVTREEKIIHFVIGTSHKDEKRAFIQQACESTGCLEIPEQLCKSERSMVRFTMSHPQKQAYILHAPLKGKGAKAREVFYAIQCMKNGFMCSRGVERQNDHPSIVVFTDDNPAFDSVEEGIWKLWQIAEGGGAELAVFEDNWRERRRLYWDRKRDAEIKRIEERARRRWARDMRFFRR